MSNETHQEAYDRLKKAAKEKQATNTTEQRTSTGRSAGQVFVEEARIVPVEDTEL